MVPGGGWYVDEVFPLTVDIPRELAETPPGGLSLLEQLPCYK